MNKVFLIGRITKDIETKSAGNSTLAEFGLAVNHKYTANGEKKEKASFFNCKAWGKTGEIIAKYFQKGSKILIEGRLDQNSWEKDGQKRSSVEIIVESFEFMDGKKSDGGNVEQEPVGGAFSDSDVPF